jgi:hypothetical protein
MEVWVRFPKSIKVKRQSSELAHNDWIVLTFNDNGSTINIEISTAQMEELHAQFEMQIVHGYGTNR